MDCFYSGMKKSLTALAFGTLGLGIAEFVMMGILPDVAKTKQQGDKTIRNSNNHQDK